MSDDLTGVHALCIQKNLSFATFRLPRQSAPVTYIQTAPSSGEGGSVSDLPVEKGFLMAPFEHRNGKKYLLVRPDIIIEGKKADRSLMDRMAAMKENPLPAREPEEPLVIGKEEFIKQVRSIRKQISKGAFQKAVLSRIVTVDGNYIPVISDIFLEVCRKHPNAFVYVLRHEGHFWLGASPEPLLRLSGGQLSTVSLAGTRPYAGENMDLKNWTLKEIVEQEYVTRYIHDILHAFRIDNYRVTSPYVKRAGDLVHLRTDFSFDFAQLSGRIWELVDALHPTPAVAGQPKEDAVRFIRQIEPHDREYYTGFLGPIHSEGAFDLFVNLRCMKITPRYLSLYIGGGITLESNPGDEWDETCWKAQGLLNIIHTFSPESILKECR
ncbi:MAG: chorismate-binding protein [Bacteroidales bacterium]|nr:chorismate-binding protein [Bacteroidales bacterium]